MSDMFDRRQLELENAIGEYARMYGAANAAKDLPAKESVGLHRCGDGFVLSTDNASAALAAERKIGELIGAAVEKSLGAEQCAKMSASELSARKLTYGANCFRHLPNTCGHRPGLLVFYRRPRGEVHARESLVLRRRRAVRECWRLRTHQNATPQRLKYTNIRRCARVVTVAVWSSRRHSRGLPGKTSQDSSPSDRTKPDPTRRITHGVI